MRGVVVGCFGALTAALLIPTVAGVGSAAAAGVATLSAVRSVDFGSATVPLVGFGPQMDVLLTNAGTATLHLGSPSITGPAAADFVLVTPTAPMQIGPGSDRTLTIEFLPSVVGNRTAYLTMSSNDPAWNPVSITLTGIGTAPAGGTSGGGGGGGGGGTTGSRYIAAPPQRLVDTRQSLGIAAALTASAPATITLPTSVPTGATAVVMNVTATRTTGAGFVTLWPAGQPQPVASNLNIELPGQTIANLVTVPAGQGGGVSVVASSATDLVVDLAGWYVLTPAVAAGRLVPITPTRVLDTRDGDGSPVGPASSVLLALAGTHGLPVHGMSAVVLNLTVTGPDSGGYVTVWPSDQDQPATSNVNPERAGETIANQAIVPMPASGSLRIFSSASAHVIVDVTGWFTDTSQPVSSSGLFWPVGPTRVLDTRSGSRPFAGVLVAVPLAAAGVPTTASAVVANVTATDAAEPGFVTACSGVVELPLASNLNVDHVGQTIPNHVTTPVDHQAFALYTNRGTHLLVDVSGWYSG